MKNVVLLFLLMLAFGFGQDEPIRVAYTGTPLTNSECVSPSPDLTYADLQFCALLTAAEDQRVNLEVTFVQPTEADVLYEAANNESESDNTYDFFISPGFLDSAETLIFLNRGYEGHDEYFGQSQFEDLLARYPRPRGVGWALNCDCDPGEGGGGCDMYFITRDALMQFYPGSGLLLDPVYPDLRLP